jgi:hypothetical protein
LFDVLLDQLKEIDLNYFSFLVALVDPFIEVFSDKGACIFFLLKATRKDEFLPLVDQFDSLLLIMLHFVVIIEIPFDSA